MITPEQIAWAAGFFDGEGCFYAAKSAPRRDGTQRITLCASCWQQDRELLDRFARIIGFGKVYLDKKKGNLGRPVFTWRGYSRGVVVFNLLKKWLSTKRIAKARKIIALATESRKTKYPAWNKGKKKVLP